VKEKLAKALEYRGLQGTVKFFEEDQVFNGRIVGIDDFIAFEGNDLKQLEENFQTEVDQYLDLNALEAQSLGEPAARLRREAANEKLSPESENQVGRASRVSSCQC
jgi:predicted HicB family RNase H-like nuclease